MDLHQCSIFYLWTTVEGGSDYFCDHFLVNLVKGDASEAVQGRGRRGIAERCSLANCSTDGWGLLAHNIQNISFCSVVRSQEKSWPRLCCVIDGASPSLYRRSAVTCTTCSAHGHKETREGHKLWFFTCRCWLERSTARRNKRILNQCFCRVFESTAVQPRPINQQWKKMNLLCRLAEIQIRTVHVSETLALPPDRRCLSAIPVWVDSSSVLLKCSSLIP